MTIAPRSFPRWLALGLILGPAVFSPARAQPALSPDRVTFFTEPNFKGEALVVEAGAAVDNLGTLARANSRAWTFAISSVRVEGAAKAVVHSAPAFRGARLEITRSIGDLYGVRRADEPGTTWDRAIASISVVGPPRIVAPPTPIVVQPPPTTVIVVPAPPPPPRTSPREADAIVQHAYREVLDRNADPEGLRRYRDRLISEGWSERQVIEALQRSPEARAINADEAIARMFREVLGRDPDPSGLNTYRARWRDGWTQGRIRDDLAHSQEGRQSFARLAIGRAYKELLGRDPDPAGYATYEKLIREQNWTERQLREAIMSSDEYRQRQRRK
ncbi:MAG: DUF4214 domain-containing protein [Opitutaceae bacterium]